MKGRDQCVLSYESAIALIQINPRPVIRIINANHGCWILPFGDAYWAIAKLEPIYLTLQYIDTLFFKPALTACRCKRRTGYQPRDSQLRSPGR